MSIRLLTEGLQNEAAETQRRQQYDVARAPQTDPVSPQPTFLTGSGKKGEAKPRELGVSSPPRQVSLKKRATHNPWGVPGGIAARFGQESLQEQDSPEPEAIEESPQTTEPAASTPAPEPEQPAEQEEANREASDEDENVRITIELQ